MEKWQQSIERYRLLDLGDRIVVGVSGGPDSMALLHLLQQAAEQYHCQLLVVHVNHQIRGQQADQEADFVAQWCHKAQLPCQVVVRNVPKLARSEGLSPEEAGRMARFEAFREAAETFGANKLALGHHRDDRAETVLLHLLQGCGLDGLAALPPQEKGIIRPLIDASKAELIAYCQAYQLPYYWDVTNDEPIYLRNRIRLELLPQLKTAYNPQMAENLVHLAILADEEKAFLQQQTEIAWQNCAAEHDGQVRLDLLAWRQLPMVLQRRVLRNAYDHLMPKRQGLSYRQTEELMQLAIKDKGQKRIDLPGGIEAIKQYQQLIFQQSKTAEAALNNDREWILPELLELPELGVTLTAEFSDQPMSFTQHFYQVVLDGERLADKLLVRGRRPGDRLRPLGMQGEKKLKAYYIDKKVPQEQRDRLPLIFSDDVLVWVPGYTIAQGYQATKNTRKFCRLTIIFADEAGFSQKINETN